MNSQSALQEIPKNVTIADLSRYIVQTNRKYDLSMIVSAYEFAVSAHGDQKRSSGEPYIVHPLSVAWILVSLGMDTECICAGLLHDVVEDTQYTMDDVCKRFGRNIAMLVDGVTKLVQLKSQALNKEDRQMASVRKMLFAMADDIRVIIIKLADRLHNMRTLHFLPPQKRNRISRETLYVYAPMADQLGIWMIKEELSDRAILFLDPIGCYEIERALQLKDADAKTFIKRIQTELQEHLSQEKTFQNPPEITGRVKSLYSIYNKVFNADKKEDMHDINEVYDKYAVRIIVDTELECYLAMGIVYAMYSPVPQRFKNYIATPKANGYRSIHLTMMDRTGVAFEVQIRTHEMHLAAEYGIAAHWKYKLGEEKGGRRMDEWFAWARKLIEEQQSADDMEEFVRNLKNDIKQDIVVMTPKGKSIFLPKGATPIDFAYRIHTEIGHGMVGAKVNNRLVPLDTPLESGQICQIECSKDPQKGPNRSWLNIVKTNEAKSKIRSWFKKERREENIQEGRAMLEREMHRNRMHVENDDELKELVKEEFGRYNCETLDDFLASIGYFGISVSNIMPRIKERYDKLNRKIEEKSNIEISMQPVHPLQGEQNAIVLDQIDHCECRLARCCNPVPGDEIIGFVTRGGHGVSIHTKTCANYQRDLATKDPERIDRWIKASWGKVEHSLPMIVSLDVLASDRVGLLLDVSKIVAELRIMILHSSSYSLKNGNAVCEIAVKVGGNDQLRQLMDKLRHIDGVISVERTKRK